MSRNRNLCNDAMLNPDNLGLINVHNLPCACGCTVDDHILWFKNSTGYRRCDLLNFGWNFYVYQWHTDVGVQHKNTETSVFHEITEDEYDSLLETVNLIGETEYVEHLFDSLLYVTRLRVTPDPPIVPPFTPLLIQPRRPVVLRRPRHSDLCAIKGRHFGLARVVRNMFLYWCNDYYHSARHYEGHTKIEVSWDPSHVSPIYGIYGSLIFHNDPVAILMADFRRFMELSNVHQPACERRWKEIYPKLDKAANYIVRFFKSALLSMKTRRLAAANTNRSNICVVLDTVDTFANTNKCVFSKDIKSLICSFLV